MPVRRALAIACALAVAAAARADVGGRLSLTGVVVSESSDQSGAAADATNTLLGWGDLRGVLEARALPGGIEGRGDFRLRLTGNFSEADAFTGAAQTTAPGYSGGREYDLRELWAGRRGAQWDVALGRQIVREADALTVDGARVTWRMRPAWQASLFGGGYPNPFSRTFGDDYNAGQPAFAFGASAAYAYPRIWGSFSAVGTYLGGPDDGGPIDAKNPAAPANRSETPRVYLTWTNYLRITDRLSLFHDAVVDVAGAAGVQLTRLDVGAHGEFGRLRVDAGYDHLSSLAIEMYLARLLRFYDRVNFMAGTIQNNLIVQRTARDEGRLRAAVRFARVDLYGEGRLRRRALAEGGDDPNFAGVGSDLAGDVTIGARDDGDLLGLRLAASFSEIAGYRAETHLVQLAAGRDFLDERLALDATFAWESNHDFGNGAMPACAVAGPAPGGLATNCFGLRNGAFYQAGATVIVRPSPRWFVIADYLLIYDAADGGQAILGHVAFARVELRL